MTSDNWIATVAVIVLLACTYILGRYHGRWSAYFEIMKVRSKREGRKR